MRTICKAIISFWKNIPNSNFKITFEMRTICEAIIGGQQQVFTHRFYEAHDITVYTLNYMATPTVVGVQNNRTNVQRHWFCAFSSDCQWD